MNKAKFISVSYIFIIIGLFLYSYTQVDLNLTLSRISIWQAIQKSFQYIGWFQRPLSTVLYTVIIVLLGVYYGIFLWLAKRNILTKKQFWWTIGISSAILLFSYNAFSYDLFNYMFDARVVTYHHQSPYIYRALDYPKDPWIHFMRWTHRLYPYGPVWLFLTVPLSFVGFQFFLPTLFLFKALAVLSFVGTIYFIGGILKKISPKDELFGMTFFAFNPLIIIEALVSAHNDIVMIFLAIAAFYFLLNKKYLRSILLLLLSIGIKFATVFLVPIFIFIFVLQAQKKQIKWDLAFLAMTVLMILAIILASLRTTFQPWYLLYILTFSAFIARRYYVFLPSIVLSLGVLLEYIPYLYTGSWDSPIPIILQSLTIGSIALSSILVLIWYSRNLLAKVIK